MTTIQQNLVISVPYNCTLHSTVHGTQNVDCEAISQFISQFVDHQEKIKF